MNFMDQLRASWLIVLFGTILFISGTVMLFWNEGRAVNTLLALEEALNEAISVKYDKPSQKSYDGRIIHVTGPLHVNEPLTETDYNIQVQAVKLKRRVQMYQWVEETIENKFGETVASVQTEDRSYYYTMEWRDELIDSRSFYIRSGHHNPTRFPIESKIYVADHVHIGDYELGPEIKSKVTNFLDVTSDTRPEDPSVKLHSGLYYHCNDVWNPEIGDIRIQFQFAGLEDEMYTVVGKLEEGIIVPYTTSTSVSQKVLLVYKGIHSLEESFKQEHRSQRLTTWGFRLFGWVLLFFAITCTSNFFQMLFSSNRFLSFIIPNMFHPVSENVTISFSIALVITSIAWSFNRPWMGAGLFLAAASPFIYCARGILNYQRLAD